MIPGVIRITENYGFALELSFGNGLVAGRTKREQVTKDFMKMKIRKVFFKYIFAYILLTPSLFSCKQESMDAIVNLDSDGNRPLVHFQLMTAHSDYALTGPGISSAATGIALTEVTITLSNCSVASDNKVINLSNVNSTIIWNNSCDFTFNSIGVNSVTKNSLGTYSFNASTVINSTTPFNAYFEKGYMLQITSVGSLYSKTSFTAPNVTLTLFNLDSKSASISSTIIPIVGSGDQFSCSLVFLATFFVKINPDRIQANSKL